MAELPRASISKDIITTDRQDFHIDGWLKCMFINTGEVAVEIFGIKLNTKDRIEFGGNTYIINEKIPIVFAQNPRNLIQKVICIYEVILDSPNKNC